MIYAIVVVLVLIADQAVKFWVTKNIVLGAVGDECVQLIPGVVHMTNYHNTGAAFSILANGRWVLVAITAIFIIAIVILVSREIIRGKFGRWMAVLVLAGAIGNCIDRVLYGYVVDMFELEFMHFAVFNVADIFITVCGVLFCLYIIIHRDPKEQTAHSRRSASSSASKAAARRAPADNLGTEPAAQEDDDWGTPPAQPDYDFAFSQSFPQQQAPAPKPEYPAADDWAPALRKDAAQQPSAPQSADEFSLESIMSEFGHK